MLEHAKLCLSVRLLSLVRLAVSVKGSAVRCGFRKSVKLRLIY